jgi:hypothetical protein
MERQCLKLKKILSIPANELMLTVLGATHTKPGQLEKLLVAARCIHDPSSSSAFIVCIMLLVNKLPGGKNGEARKALTRIIGCLGSIEHRITIVFVAAWYPIHLKWLAFSNAPSEVVPDSDVISNRTIESQVFSRSFLQEVFNLQLSWSTALPTLAAEIKALSRHSKTLSADECYERWDLYIKDSSKGMYDVAVKYFQNMELQSIGWSFLYVVDPFVGPAFAQGLLNALLKLTIISAEQASFQEPHYRHATPSEFKAPFTLDSSTRAFPLLSYPDTVKSVETSFLASLEGTQAIVAAYALTNAGVLAELKAIANGRLKAILTPTDWIAGTGVRKYYDLFKQEFPYLEDVLQMNFSTPMLATTSVEAAFAVGGMLSQGNSSHSHNSERLNFALRVKGPSLREQRAKAKKYEKKIPKRQLRSVQSRAAYSMQLNKIAKFSTLPLVFGRRALKVRKDYEAARPFVQKEMCANDESNSQQISGDDIADQILVFDQTKIRNEIAYPASTGDKLLEEKATKLKKAAAISILAMYAPDMDTRNIKRRRANDDLGNNINDALANVWRQCPDAHQDDTADDVRTKKARHQADNEDEN